MTDGKLQFYEFFAGGGMARLGLGSSWNCVFANEWCRKKASSYTLRFGVGTPKTCQELKVKDVAKLTTTELPGQADLAWASFPCQDLSLAGAGAGLNGERSGTFKPFWKLMQKLVAEGRAPRVVTLENVVGTITSHKGRDFAAIITSLMREGYRAGAMVIDAVRFLPQSRPRLFIVGVRKDQHASGVLTCGGPNPSWHPASLIKAHEGLPGDVKEGWAWWALPEPGPCEKKLSDLIEDEPGGVRWHTPAQTQELLRMMSSVNQQKLRKVQAHGRRTFGTVYKRTRPDEDGIKTQRAEIRFDDISGCLRTPAGGSSRQIVVEVHGDKVRSRLVSPREAARLMGVPEDYVIPDKYNEAYHLFGDGLAVPVVAWLNEHLLTPLASGRSEAKAA